jgi:hypothetical protein
MCSCFPEGIGNVGTTEGKEGTEEVVFMSVLIGVC